MAKPEWGVKRICQSCGARFYDLNRTPILCPKCEAEFDPEAWMRSRRVRASEKPKAARPAPVIAVEADDEEVDADDADEAALIADDDDDLPDDDDIEGLPDQADDPEP